MAQSMPPQAIRCRRRLFAPQVLLALAFAMHSQYTHASPIQALRAPLKHLGSLYGAALSKNPILTHCVQGATISGIGDLACQLYVKDAAPDLRAQALSLQQVAGASCTGVIFGGLLIPAYYRKIQALLPSRHPAAVAFKVALDGVLWGYAGNFLLVAMRGLLEGGKPQECMKYANSVIWPVFKNDCSLWIPYNSLCYGVIPKSLQPLSTATVSAMWSAYISYVSVEEKRRMQQPGAWQL